MKVLAIRGSNLASLAGPFELPLATGPLADAGLFVISGPTGAGKSTLLDALCLALFDDTPRLRQASSQAKVHEAEPGATLSAGDPRQLLSRGAASGFAEVDFEGRDGEAYRARWEVNRARGRSEGRLQAQTLSLTRLSDGQGLGGTKNETKLAIEEKLGLNADQFMRAVLLPQGDFAAFLRADEAKRAELLERLTGTQLYGRLSEMAHARAREAKKALEQEAGILGALALLTPEARTEAEAQAQAAALAHQEAESAWKALEAAQAWLAQAEALAVERALAQASLEAAEARLQGPDGQALQANLKEAEAAWAQAPALSKARDLKESLASTELAHQAALAEGQSLAGAATQAQAVLADAEKGHQEALARAAEARPRLEAAALLAQKEEALHQALAEAQAQAALSAQVAELATAAWQEAQAQEAQAQGAAQAAEAWLQSHPQEGVLAQAWARGQALVRAHGQLLQQRREAQAHLLEAEAQVQTALAEVQAAEAALAQSQAQEAACQKACLATEAALQPGAKARWEAEAQACASWREALLEGQALVQAAEGRHKALLEAEQALQAAEAACQEATLEQQEAEATQGLLQARLEEAESAWRLVQAAEDFAQHRHLLREGEPCPLCGAEVHPWAVGEGPKASETQAARVQALQAESQQAAARVAQTQGRLGASQARLAHAQAAQAQGLEGHQQALAAWALWAAQPPSAPWPQAHLGQALAPESPPPKKGKAKASKAPAQGQAPLFAAAELALPASAALDLGLPGQAGPSPPAAATAEPSGGGPPWGAHWPPPGEGPEALARLASGLAHVARAEAAWQAESLAWEAAQVAHQEALAALQAAGASWRHHKEALDGAQGRLKAAEGPRAEAQKALDLAAGLLTRDQGDLESLLGESEGWEAALEADLEAFMAALSARVAQAQGQAQRLAEAQSLLQRLAAQAPLLAQDAQAKAAQAQAQAEQVAALSPELAALKAQLQALLPEGSVAALKALLEAEGQAAQAALALAQEAQTASALALARAEAQAQGLALQLANLEAELLAHAEGLAKALQASGISQEQAEGLWAQGAAWLEGLRAEWEGCRQAQATALARLGDRQAAMVAHEAKRQAAWPLEGLSDALEAGERAREAGRLALAAAQLRLAQDDEAKQAHSLRAAQVATLEAEWQAWAELDELIGSGDGKKFRTFAQGLSLGLLVEAANGHLAELHPRYRLEQAEGQALALQLVDLDMGEERRGPLSLSGGETFLVSLALALALGALRAGEQRLGSLFIDEGFGSLDAQALELALHALDALQASGRQVGLISHVPGLGERIGAQVQVLPQGGGRSKLSVG